MNIQELRDEIRKLYEELEMAQADNDRQAVHDTQDAIRQAERELLEAES